MESRPVTIPSIPSTSHIGAEAMIGQHAVIGSSVWLTHSVSMAPSSNTVVPFRSELPFNPAPLPPVCYTERGFDPGVHG
jgi:hypothetical protein